MKSPRSIAVLALLGALAVALAAAPAAGAARHPRKRPIPPPAKTRIGRVALARTPSGRPALLVAVRYPIQAAGRLASVSVAIQGGPSGDVAFHRLSAGAPRRPERRRAFTFVHELRLAPPLARELSRRGSEGRGATVVVSTRDGIDIDEDGRVDIGSGRVLRRAVRIGRGTASASGSSASGPLCASSPIVELPPRGHAQIALPACTRPVRWSVTSGASAGTVHLAGDHLDYTAPRAPGTATIGLDHATVVVKVVRPWTTPAPGATSAPGPVVRAMGDSVTAGFGFYSDGKPMSFSALDECKPVGDELDDACSSNSTATADGLAKVPYAPDYGLANNISWAAQWANEYGVTNYKNFAVSGSEPSNWLPTGDLGETTERIEAEDPDYILMTIGANPILSNTLFGLGSMACALESDIVGGYRECVEEAFEEVHLRRELRKLYTNLVEKTHATIYLMQYHLAIPSSALAYSATQIAQMGMLMNETIASVAQEVDPGRLEVVTPPHFNAGINLEPIYPSTFTCSYFDFGVDGPSVQSTPTQDELEAAHFLSFCGGPEGGGEPWVIGADTGIHPSPAGYAQMAGAVPPPAPGG